MAQVAVPSAPHEHAPVLVESKDARRRGVDGHRMQLGGRGELGGLLCGLADDGRAAEGREWRRVHRELQQLRARRDHR